MNRLTPVLGNLCLTICLTLCACDDDIRSPTTNPTALTSGIDLSARNSEVRPQDDFFEYVNGHWIANTEIPADRGRYGSFIILREKAQQDLHSIIEDFAKQTQAPAGSPAQIIGDLYNSFMNEGSVEAAGIKPLQTDLERIQQLQNLDDLAAFIARAERYGIDVPFHLWVDQDLKQPENYILHIDQQGLGLPDRDYYFDDSEKGQDNLSAYQQHMATLLSFIHHPAPAEAAKNIMALEVRLASQQWTGVDNRDSEKTYNKMSRTEVEALLPDFPFATYLREANLESQQQFVVLQPSYLQGLNNIFTDTAISTWQDYLRLRLVSAQADVLSNDIAKANFNFYGKTLRGVEEQRPRWKRAVALINDNIGELLGQAYVEKYFPPADKARVQKLVDNLILAYAQSIEQLDWMSDTTKQKALEKLNKFTTKIGYPDQWPDYSGLKIEKNNLLGNRRAVIAWGIDKQRAKLGQALNRDEWFMTPQTVSAYYNPSLNEIAFPAAMLQPPFYNRDADDAVNYGAIGAVIGHEIGHGFDDQGSQYDGDGRLVNWWSQEDLDKFHQRSGRLVEQYNAYQPLPDTHINGERTLGENIGDLAGLAIAYKAYQIALEGRAPITIDGLTGEQRFFMGFAQAWRFKTRDGALRERLRTNLHSPVKYRVNGVLPNIDAFYTTFDVKEGDGMWLPPEERVYIW